MRPRKTRDDEKDIRTQQPLIEKDDVKQAEVPPAKTIKKPEIRSRHRLW